MDAFQGSQDNPTSLHKYFYCGADPVRHSDPGGHDYEMLAAIGDIFASSGGMIFPSIGAVKAVATGTGGPDASIA